MGTIKDNKNDEKMKFNMILSQRRRRQRLKRKIAMPFFVVLITVVLITLSWSDNIHRSCDGRGDHGGRKCNRQKTVLIVVSSFGPLIPRAIVVPHRLLFPSALPSSLLVRKARPLWMSTVVTATTTVNSTLQSITLDDDKSNNNNNNNNNNNIISSSSSSSNSDEISPNGFNFNFRNKNYIPPEELDKLMDTVDIVALIESYGIPEFRRTSTSYSTGDSTGFHDKATCLCPFHNDKNPSLKIDGERGIYKCFSCGSGGNALGFVREYSERYHDDDSNNNNKDDNDDAANKDDNPIASKPLTFVEAVRVLEDFVTIPIDGVQRRRQPRQHGKSNTQNKRKKKNSLIGSTPKVRILLANLHATAFFEECLFGLPSAGIARTHLRSRGIHPTTVKAFAIGFAPESYFLQQQSRPWGEGSLVYRLRDEGFTPQEIVDAGLATVTRKGKEKQEQQRLAELSRGEKSSNESNDNSDKEILQQQPQYTDFSTLMDRFRGRLVVPIFDESGTQILGFGGRILETSREASSDFKAAKYLNSPESLVFLKKELLFARHMVKFVTPPPSTTTGNSLNVTKIKTATATKRRLRSLIIVEGYMDAIALWQAGVKEVVASMGTALSHEQLLAAASTARKIGGSVVLCMDNDDAGVAAVTRLCTGSEPILLSVRKKSKIDILVANLPESVKDPAEFLEENRDVEGLDEKFRDEAIQSALEWSVWYMFHLIAAHDPSASNGEDGSFGQIFDNLASFLSIFESIDERTKKAEIVSSKLADLVDTDSVTDNDDDNNRTEVSSTTRIQLASNLVEKAASIAHSKSISFQRNFQLTRGSANNEPSRSLEISGDMNSEEDTRKFDGKKIHQTPDLESVDDSFEWTQKKQKKPPMKRQRARMKRGATTNPSRGPMTKHITGIRSNTFDDEWLGVTKDKYTNQRNPLRYELNPAQTAGTKKYIGPESSIRFNKNEYHGVWTTSDAAAAGYTPQSISNKNMDFLEKGTGSLIQSNEDDKSMFVEDLLFTILARFLEARKSLYESIQISEASGSGGEIQWSSPEKSWLFKCLVEEMEEIPRNIVGLDDLGELRSYLKNLPDSFPGAFGSTFEHENQIPSKEIENQVMSSVVDLPAEQTKSSLSDDENKIIEDSTDSSEDWELSVEASLEISTIESIPGAIPAIPELGEEWSDFPEIGDLGGEGFGDDYNEMMSSSHIDGVNINGEMIATEIQTVDEGIGDSLDSEKIEGGAASIKDTDKPDFLEAEFVVSEIPPSTNEEEIILQEGSLDRLFMKGAGNSDIFTKYYSDADSISSGSNEDKANWAIQDLYTVLEYTSVLKRIDAGRRYMEENKETWFNTTIDDQDDNTTSTTAKELAEYCSSQASDRGLRKDLHRIRNLKEKNKQATDRIFALMHADFTDKSADIRGYSWLKNVLRLNEQKTIGLNDIIESKEDFRHSNEGLDDLEDVVCSDWNELSDPEEMWEFEKNVDTNHRSHFVDLVVDRESNESVEDFSERYLDDWDGYMDEEDEEEEGGDADDDNDDNDDDDHEESESVEEFSGRYEDDWNSLAEEDGDE